MFKKSLFIFGLCCMSFMCNSFAETMYGFDCKEGRFGNKYVFVLDAADSTIAHLCKEDGSWENSDELVRCFERQEASPSRKAPEHFVSSNSYANYWHGYMSAKANKP